MAAGLAFAALAVGPLHVAYSAYDRRHGAAEAVDNSRAGLPIKLSAQSASNGTDLRPRCDGPFQLCGYSDAETTVERIPRQFEVAEPFSQGLAAVRVDGLYGYIDPTGRMVIAPHFEAAGSFLGGYAEVRLHDASGIIDRSGRLVIPARFHRILPFSGDSFVATPLREDEARSGTSEERLDGLSSPVFFSSDAGGLYHLRKGWLTGQNLRFDLFDAPARGLIWAREGQEDEEKWGLLRSDGTWQVSPRYNHVQRLMETHAIVTSMRDASLPPQQRRAVTRWGAVDRDGRLVVPLKFAHLSYWSGGYGRAHEEKPYRPDGSASHERMAFVRADGTLLANRYFDAVEMVEKGRLPRGRIGTTWYSIAPDGRLLPDQRDGAPLVACQGGLSILQRGEMVEFRRPDGKAVGRFDKGYFQARDCPGPFSAQRGAKWYVVLEDGKVLGGNSGFDNLYETRGSHIAVQVAGKWGIIDRSGTFTVTPQFAALRPDRSGTFAIGTGDGAYWIDSSGARVDRPESGTERSLACKGGLHFFQRDGLWGLQDAQGKTVIAPRFRALSCFAQGVSWTALPSAARWCAIGPDGEPRAKLACRETYYPMAVTHHAPEKFSDDPYQNSMLWTRAWLDYQAGARDQPPTWVPDYGNGGTYSVMPGPALGKPVREFEMRGGVWR